MKKFIDKVVYGFIRHSYVIMVGVILIIGFSTNTLQEGFKESPLMFIFAFILTAVVARIMYMDKP